MRPSLRRQAAHELQRQPQQVAAAGVVAVFTGGLAGWAVSRFVMETDFVFNLPSALMIVTGGVLATLIAGLAFAWRPLAARPARVLRARE